MKRATLVVLAAVIVALTAQASAVRLTIEIAPLIKEMTFFFNYSDNADHTTQRFWTYWENRGSIGCTNRLRVDVYNRSLNIIGKDSDGNIEYMNDTNQRKLIYTAWSKSEVFQPGTNADLYAYFLPFNMTGTFSAQPRVYSCNEIFYIDPVEFKADGINEDTADDELFEYIRMENVDRNHIEITVVPKNDMNQTIAFPEKHIHGWIIEPVDFGVMKAGAEYSQTMYYEAAIWMPKNITIGFSANDGKQYVRDVFEVNDDYSSPCSYATIMVAVLILMICAVVVNMSRKRMKRDKNKTEKRQAHMSMKAEKKKERAQDEKEQ